MSLFNVRTNVTKTFLMLLTYYPREIQRSSLLTREFLFVVVFFFFFVCR